MSEKDKMCDKLHKLYTYYEELKTNSQITLEEYQTNTLYKRAIERTLQLIVECATDINNMLLKYYSKKGSTDYFNSFIDLAEEHIIPMDFALKIAPSTGLRNILVHEYEKIDDTIVYCSITSCLQYYLEYINLINNYLNCK